MCIAKFLLHYNSCFYVFIRLLYDYYHHTLSRNSDKIAKGPLQWALQNTEEQGNQKCRKRLSGERKAQDLDGHKWSLVYGSLEVTRQK